MEKIIKKKTKMITFTFGTCTTGVTHTVPSLFVWRCCIFATIVWYIDAVTGTVITPLTEIGKSKQFFFVRKKKKYKKN